MEQVSRVQTFFNSTGNYLHQSFGIKVRAEIVSRMVGAVSGCRILDIGCGNGAISGQFVASNEVTFLDLSENMIDLARGGVDERFVQNAKFLTGSFMEIDLRGKFDHIFAIGLVAHLSSVPDALQRIASLVEDGGQIVLQFSNFNNWLTKLNVKRASRYGYPINRLRYQDMVNHIRSCGLVIEKQVQYSFLLPGMGSLPESFLYKYSKFTVDNPLMSPLGTDFIWLLHKRAS